MKDAFQTKESGSSGRSSSSLTQSSDNNQFEILLSSAADGHQHSVEPKTVKRVIESSSKHKDMKYILVTGGVISGIGKGVVASSIGVILRHYNFSVTCIKVDPYINIDAGTFSPYEHGEVYVLDDGGEVDLDLGNYERFLDVTLTRDNNITTGKVYSQVIERERAGKYLGKTVQVIPQITDAIQEWVERVSVIPVDDERQRRPEVCIIELGGIVGDIESMPFVEAFRQLQFKVGQSNFCTVHVSLVPKPKSVGEFKTKPTQASVREIRGLGLSPNLIICRSCGPVGDEIKQKVSTFCHVRPDEVLNVYDCPSIYHVPLLLHEEGIVSQLCSKLNLNALNNSTIHKTSFLYQWTKMADYSQVNVSLTADSDDAAAGRYPPNRRTKHVQIALVGKYVQLEDSYVSVVKALRHAASSVNRSINIVYIESSHLEESKKVHSGHNGSGSESSASNLGGLKSSEKKSDRNIIEYHRAWKDLCESDGLLVPGGFGSRGIEGKIAAIKWAREHRKPFLGVCLGLQCAVIEFARNVLGWSDANSTEVDPSTSHPVIVDMPEHNVEGKVGGTMRLGKKRTVFHDAKCESVVRRLYGGEKTEFIEERHRHRYEVNPTYIDDFEHHNMRFVGRDDSDVRMEIVELFSTDDEKNSENNIAPHYFVGTQFHPEYLSRPMKPSPPYIGLLLAASGQLGTFLDKLKQSTQSGSSSPPEFVSSPPPNKSSLSDLLRMDGTDLEGGCGAVVDEDEMDECSISRLAEKLS